MRWCYLCIRTLSRKKHKLFRTYDFSRRKKYAIRAENNLIPTREFRRILQEHISFPIHYYPKDNFLYDYSLDGMLLRKIISLQPPYYVFTHFFCVPPLQFDFQINVKGAPAETRVISCNVWKIAPQSFWETSFPRSTV